QSDEVFQIEGTRAVCPRVEEPPHSMVFLHREKDELFFDQVFVKQFLVERAHGPFQRVRHAEIFGGDQVSGVRERDLQDAAAYVDLNQIRRVFQESVFAKNEGVEIDRAPFQHPVDGCDELGANRVQIGCGRSAEGPNLVSPAQQLLVLLEQR